MVVLAKVVPILFTLNEHKGCMVVLAKVVPILFTLNEQGLYGCTG